MGNQHDKMIANAQFDPATDWDRPRVGEMILMGDKYYRITNVDWADAAWAMSNEAPPIKARTPFYRQHKTRP